MRNTARRFNCEARVSISLNSKQSRATSEFSVRVFNQDLLWGKILACLGLERDRKRAHSSRLHDVAGQGAIDVVVILCPFRGSSESCSDRLGTRISSDASASLSSSDGQVSSSMFSSSRSTGAALGLAGSSLQMARARMAESNGQAPSGVRNFLSPQRRSTIVTSVASHGCPVSMAQRSSVGKPAMTCCFSSSGGDACGSSLRQPAQRKASKTVAA